MMEILLPILIVGGIGLLAGAGLAIASAVMAVPTDQTAEQIRECLPGANCGACGYSGCDGYADALAKGVCDKTGLCAPGGEATAKAIAAALGVEPIAAQKQIATVHCAGVPHNATVKMLYHGTKSCRTAKQLYGGDKACVYGCIGLGDCAKFCPFDAITMVHGAPIVDPAVCTGCGMCVTSCPKEIISLEPINAPYTVRCRNQDKGAVAVKVCKVSCIGCGMCVKVCEHASIAIRNACAIINPATCIGCGRCVDACKRGAIEAK